MWEVVIESGGAGFLYKVEAPDIARASAKAEAKIKIIDRELRRYVQAIYRVAET